MVDSPCFLVSAKPSSYPVFGWFWTQFGPKLGLMFFLGLEVSERVTFLPRAAGSGDARAPSLSPRELLGSGWQCVVGNAWTHPLPPADSSGYKSGPGFEPATFGL